MSAKGFTIIELVIGIVVIGILSVVAMPRFMEIVNTGRAMQESSIVGSVRESINLARMDNVTKGINPGYPAVLDNATPGAASSNNPLFDQVLHSGINKLWEKMDKYLYKGPTGTLYSYNPDNGTFNPAGGYVGYVNPSSDTWPPPGTSPVQPVFVTATGNSAFRNSGGYLRAWSGDNIVAWLGTTWWPGSLDMKFTNSFYDGPGNDFAIRTGNECWGKDAGSARFDFYLDDTPVTSFSTNLEPNKWIAFQFPGTGLKANRVVITNTSPLLLYPTNDTSEEILDFQVSYSE